MKHYHYIFTGSGLSALMTVYEMVLSGKFDDKSILLIDEDSKKRMVFRFGISEQEIKDKLYERDLVLEFEKKVTYES